MTILLSILAILAIAGFLLFADRAGCFVALFVLAALMFLIAI